MKAVLFFVLLAATLCAAVSDPSCFPQCTWNCDRPACPAQCTPQCEKPQCELRCEKLPETACDIRCEKPKCEVRCSRSNCASGGCPLCENVCLPAKCQTVCSPASPRCKPTCSAPKCTWSCRKPASCPKPRCNLGCAPTPNLGCGAQQSCCSCHTFQNMVNAIEIASSKHRESHGVDVHPDLMPSFVEVAHEVRLRSKLGAEGGLECCPCAAHH